MTNLAVAARRQAYEAEGMPAPEEAWVAVRDRDERYVGRFLYGVMTTGIYCRPGCASRTPKRENVRFFSSAEGAESAGLRPCRRCRPDGAGQPGAARSVALAREYLEAHLEETVTLERLSRVAHMSPHHLQRTFKRLTGLSPREYVRAGRMRRMKARLRAGDTVSRAAYEAGHGSTSRVYEHAEAHLGMTPGRYRQGGEGEQIAFAIEHTSAGWLLVASTERGLCSVALGDDAGELEAGLRSEFDRAEIAPARDELRGWVAAILRYLEGQGMLPSGPLDVRATAFRLRVWSALQQIPFGSTVSYSQLAEAIGAPGAARAVAAACADNPVALVIPCHRVVRGDGSVSGYRWGPDRKRQLLEMERSALVPRRARSGTV